MSSENEMVATKPAELRRRQPRVLLEWKGSLHSDGPSESAETGPIPCRIVDPGWDYSKPYLEIQVPDLMGEPSWRVCEGDNWKCTTLLMRELLRRTT